jgi:hypothetical protein
MSWKFNPPPGWPPQPEGWQPPPGWAPDPSWPAPPPGWQFWVPAGAPAATSAPPATSGAAPGFGQPVQPGGYPTSGGAAWGPATATPERARPWYGRWWAILGLLLALLVGAGAGYGLTALALDASEEDGSNALAAAAYQTTIDH